MTATTNREVNHLAHTSKRPKTSGPPPPQRRGITMHHACSSACRLAEVASLLWKWQVIDLAIHFLHPALLPHIPSRSPWHVIWSLERLGAVSATTDALPAALAKTTALRIPNWSPTLVLAGCIGYEEERGCTIRHYKYKGPVYEDRTESPTRPR